MKDTLFGCQADWTNVLSEGHRLTQFHQGDVIIEKGVVVLWMDDDGLNTNSYFICVGNRRALGFSSQVQCPKVDISTIAMENWKQTFALS